MSATRSTSASSRSGDAMRNCWSRRPDRGDEPAARVLGRLWRTDEHPRSTTRSRTTCDAGATHVILSKAAGTRRIADAPAVPASLHDGFAILLAAAAAAFGVSHGSTWRPSILVVAGMVLYIDAFPVECCRTRSSWPDRSAVRIRDRAILRARQRRRSAGRIISSASSPSLTGIALLLGHARLTAAYVGLALAASSRSSSCVCCSAGDSCMSLRAAPSSACCCCRICS